MSSAIVPDSLSAGLYGFVHTAMDFLSKLLSGIIARISKFASRFSKIDRPQTVVNISKHKKPDAPGGSRDFDVLGVFQCLHGRCSRSKHDL
jgi:hypothetical protein